LDEACCDANLRRHEMLPLVPGLIPPEREKRGIDIHLCFPPAIAVEREPLEVFDPALLAAAGEGAILAVQRGPRR
jgi:hypothetical protein